MSKITAHILNMKMLQLPPSANNINEQMPSEQDHCEIICTSLFLVWCEKTFQLNIYALMTW